MSDWQDWIGTSRATTARLDPEQANRMAVTLDREPVFRAGDPLPPAWHWLYFHEVVRAASLGEDGHPALGVTMPPVPLPRRMWAGGSLAFRGPLPLGATATRTSTIRSVVEKHGRTGPLFFVSVEHDVQVDGRSAVFELATLLMDLAVRHDRPLGTFEYRARSPLFLPDAFTVNGRRDGARTSLWASSVDGRLAMTAQARDV